MKNQKYLICLTSHLPSDVHLKERAYCLSNSIYIRPECVVCKSPVRFQSMKNGYGKTCSRECNGIHSQSKMIVKPFQRKDIQEKVKNTHTLKHGVPFPFQNSSIQQSITEQRIEQHGSRTPSFLSESQLAILGDRETVEEMYLRDKSPDQIAKLVGVTKSTVLNYIHKYNIPVIRAFDQQNEIAEFIREFGFEVIENDRRAIAPLEIDCFVPSLSLGIEFNGCYWHSTDISKKDYRHKRKFDAANERGIRLLQINDIEWNDPIKKEIWKSIIKNHLGLSKRLFARKLVVEEKSARNFFDQNHLQGSRGKFTLTLNDHGDIVAAMSFGKSRFNKNDQWELIRFCCKRGTVVVGGASRLLQQFLRQTGAKSITSYSDNRYSNGNLYRTIGFKEDGESLGYQYYKRDRLFSRFQFQKHKLSKLEFFDPDKSEFDNMAANGYLRLWDAGQKRWVYETL